MTVETTLPLTHPKAIWNLLRATFTEWTEDQAPRLGAALAYYSVFSLAPLLVIIVSIVGLVFDPADATGQVVREIQGLAGPETAAAIEGIIQNTNQPATGLFATIVSLVVLLFGASGVFGELHQSLNTIWDIEPKPKQGIWATIKDRFFTFSMVLGTGFMLLTSLVISAVISGIGTYMNGWLPGWEAAVQVINFFISFAIITVLFGLIFRYVPDADIAWSDVWLGAIVTALLFTIGKALIGLYIGHSSFASTYGAAASLAVILFWVYYSSQILFFGAEFTQVYANTYGSRIRSQSTGQLTEPSVTPTTDGKPVKP
jgi:membrane protein